jgi:hypothetical protein
MQQDKLQDTRPQDAQPQCVERRTAIRYHVRREGGRTWVQDVKSTGQQGTGRQVDDASKT